MVKVLLGGEPVELSRPAFEHGELSKFRKRSF